MDAQNRKFPAYITACLALTLGVAPGCGAEGVATLTAQQADAAPEREMSSNVQPTGLGLAAPASPLAADLTAFTQDLYRVLGKGSGNVAFSPHAIAMALGMVSLGADGNTVTQMRDVLHWDQTPQADLPAALAAWREQLSDSASDGATLAAANAVWGAKGLAPSPNYVAALKQGFDSSWHEMDIAGATDSSRREINGWVNTHTDGLVPELLQAGQLDPASRMVVTSALSMTAPWQNPFPLQASSEAAFYGVDGHKSAVTMMHKQTHARFAETDAMQAVDLAYADGALRFTVLLPNEGYSLSDAVSAKSIDAALAALRTRTVVLSLPRFHVSGQYSLREILQGLGMRDAFDASAANFANITGAKDLALTDVVHQAIIDVDEAGTRAAAATGAVMMPTAVPADQVTVTVDRPFIFLIRDTNLGSLLFVGRIEQP